MVTAFVGKISRWALDFALPPRCAGCGTIVADVHSFCPDCWKGVEFLGDSGCSTCGIPLQATEQATCGACLARAPRIARTRAAVAYGDLARGLAIRLKYGRKVAIARTMARYMAPLVGGTVIGCWFLCRSTALGCGAAVSTSRHSSLASCRGGLGSRPIRWRSRAYGAPRRSKA